MAARLVATGPGAVASFLALSVLCTPLSAQVVLATLNGSAAGDQFGTALTYVLDQRLQPPVREDALVVGAPWASFLGNQVGTVTLHRWSPAAPYWSQAGFPSFGSNSLDEYGKALAAATDVDGDGITDFVVGAPGTHRGLANASGAVYLQDGDFGGQLNFFNQGPGAGWRMGDTVGAPGNVMGTAWPEFVGGIPSYTNSCAGYSSCYQSGTQYVGGFYLFDSNLLAPNPAPSHSVFGRGSGCGGPCYNDWIARSIQTVGDLDNNGLDEVLIGAYADGGLRIYGWDNATSTIILKYAITNPASDFGRAVCSLGDLDNPPNGVPEIAVGAPDAGKVFIYSGDDIIANGPTPNPIAPRNTLDWTGVAGTNGAGGRFGQVLANAGDLDGDGRNDLLVGAPEAVGFGAVNAGAGAGQVLVFSGSNFALMGFLQGDKPGDRFGAAITRAPDFTGDGRPEFAVGAPLADVAAVGSDAGRVYLATFDPTTWHTRVLNGGCACQPSQLPRIGLPNGAPCLGHSDFSFGVANGLSGYPGILGLGFGLQNQPLPWCGCALGIALADTQFLTLAGGPRGTRTGGARYRLPVPSNPIFLGVQIDAQWYLFNPNPIPGVMTHVLRTVVQATCP